MFRTLKARWRTFVSVPRGERFQAHHRRSHRPDAPRWARVAAIAAAVVLMAIGVVMIVLPGPGLLVILAGAAMLAGESLLVARAMDRVDFHAQRLLARWQRKRSRIAR